MKGLLVAIVTLVLTTVASGETSTYVFMRDQSELVQTGGIAGVHWTYSVEGYFELTVNPNASTASFTRVDANAMDDSPFKRTLDPNHVFNMTKLVGTVLEDGTVKFTGKASDDSDILITVALTDDLAHLVGHTTPPPHSADFFIFDLDAVAQRKYGGGTGEPDDPYRIATAEDLMLLGESPEDYDKHFILTADIDLDPNLPGRKLFDKAVIAPDTDAVQRGFQGTLFTGVFDGKGYTISHLTINGAGYLGLFGRLDSGAKISNLGLEAVDVNGTGDYVGGLVGGGGGSITTCYSTGTVTGSEGVGGLVGGGGGSITTCYSTGAVSGDWWVGGLVGGNGARITTCYSAGAVSGDRWVGGLVGVNEGAITSSFWDIESSGQASSAGGTGLTTAEMQDVKTYLNAGWDFADEILNGTCDYWQMSPGDYPRLCYPVMPEGLGTAEEPYLIRDARDLGTVWFEPHAHYRLGGSVDLSGTTWSVAVIPMFWGTFDGNDYVISNLHIQGSSYLGLFGELQFGAKISNLGLEAVDINGTGHYVGGLVGLNTAGSIRTSYSTGTVSASGQWSNAVGGLVGLNHGRITASYNTGAVSGGYGYGVGGLVGWNNGRITTCYSTGMVSGETGVGGLVGSGGGSITTCYSTGAVSGDWRVGGLVGSNGENITGSYSTGMVTGNEDVGGLVGRNWDGSIISSFWDIQTSGQTNMCGGQEEGDSVCDDSFGLTTAEVQTAGTFLEAGWDLINIWGIGENQTYPYLRKYSAADINEDGSVDFGDLAILANNWLASIAP